MTDYFGDFTYIDLLIPLGFILAIYLAMKWNKKRLNQKRHEAATRLEYPSAIPAIGTGRFDELLKKLFENFPVEYHEVLANIDFYLVPEPHLNGQRIYGLAITAYNRIFLDEETIRNGTDVNAVGLLTHEFAHVLYGHTRGTEENERQAGLFAREWIKNILGVTLP